MPSAGDIHNEIKGVNSRLDVANGRLDEVKGKLDAVNGKLDAIKAATDAVRSAVDNANKTLQWGFAQLITIGNYTNKALHHNAEQNDTMICLLQQISKNTCELLNEAHTQTGLQKNIDRNTEALAELYAATHAEAALTRQREEALRQQIEKCCPPQEPAPICRQEPCAPPRERLGEPPQTENRPPR